MKATKAAIIRQAQLAKKDIASGRLSTHAKQAVDTLADYSNAAVELLELALDEAVKEQPDQALVDSFIFLFGQASEALRLDIEAGYKTALDIAEMVRKRLVAASQSGTVDPSMIWTLAQSFGAAKLDLGEELPAVTPNSGVRSRRSRRIAAGPNECWVTRHDWRTGLFRVAGISLGDVATEIGSDQKGAPMSDKSGTLYERLGGHAAITAVANDLLPRLRSDPQLGRFWAHRGEDGA